MIKILHLPVDPGGHALGMARAERARGLEARSLNIHGQHRFHYPRDLEVRWPQAHRLGLPGQFCSLLATFLTVRKDYDVFHFNGGHTLLDYYPLHCHYWDVGGYPKHCRRIMTFNGSDARLSLKQPHQDRLPDGHPYRLASCQRVKQKRIAHVDRWADTIFAVNPDLMNHLPKRTRFLPYAIAAWHDLPAPKPAQPSRTLHVVHAPSNRALKGTQLIIDTIRTLSQAGVAIQLTLVENKPHAQAIAIYQQADLIIDQLLIGWYGAFAVEAMKMGKPVLVYIDEADLVHVPHNMARDCMNSFIHAQPETLAAVLQRVAENRQELEHAAEAGLDYVHRWHCPEHVASLSAEAYEA